MWRADVRVLGAILGLLIAALAASAQESEPLDKSTTLAEELTKLQVEMVAVAKAVQESESELSRLEEQLIELEASAATKAADFAERHDQLAVTLAVLQRLSLRPPEALILGDAPPIDTVHRALLLRVAVPAIAARADTIRQEIDRLDRYRRDIASRRLALADTADKLRAQSDRITAMMARKKELQKATLAERKAAAGRVATLAREARSLRELLASLTAPQPGFSIEPAPPLGDGAAGATPAALLLARPDTIRPFPVAQASLTPPAIGRVSGTFGEGDGAFSEGIVIETRLGAQIVAPFDGQIKFRGPFLGYGEILIVEHDGGYHTLLAGLERIDGLVGQWLLAGEPVGAMPATDPKPALYIELRYKGEPIDPLPWLARE